jgi:hypothetical protein
MRRFACLCLLILCSLAPGDARALSISADGRQLLNSEGRTIFLNGTAPWAIVARLTREETIHYLDTRREAGFNALLIRILVNDDFHTGSFDNAYGEPPFLVPNDFTTPNEAYFQHVDWFMEQATRRGFYLLVAPAYLGYNCTVQGFCQAMIQAGPSVMRDWGRWIGARYASHDNLIWIDGGDTNAADRGAMDVVDAVAEGIVEASPDQLHSAHADRYTSAIDGYDRPWLDLNSTYSDCQQTPSQLHNDWERNPARPFFYIEGYYENENGATDVCLRSQAYWSLLGGAFGHIFGNRPMWDFWSGWENALDSSGSQSMRYFRNLIYSRDWKRLEPDWDHLVLVSGYGSPDAGYAAAARTNDGHTIVVYTPFQRILTIDMTQLSGNKASAWWFNPSDGSSQFISSIPTTGTHEFSPPSSGDWVLVIDDEAIELPAPGQSVSARVRSTGEFKSRHLGRQE